MVVLDYATWIEKISKVIRLDLATHIKNGKWIFLKFGAMALGGWLLSLAFARLGTKEILGQYQYILSFVAIISLASLPGLNVAALEAVAKGRDASVIKAVRLSFLYSLVGLAILIGSGLYHIFFQEKILVGWALILAGILAPFYYSLNTWNIYYDGKSLFRGSALRTIAVYIVLNLALVVGLFLELNALGLVAIFLGVNTVFFGGYFLEILRKIQDRSQDMLDFRFGVNASIQRFAFSLSNTLPPLAISALFGLEAVAIYYIGYYLISAAASLMGMLGYLYIPALFRGEKIHYKRVLLQNVCLGFLFWLAVLFFIKYFFILLYGTEYLESQKLAYAFSFLIALVPLKVFLMNFFLTLKRNWTIIAIVSIANLLSVAFLFLTQNKGFATSVTVYVYTLEFVTIVPLFLLYLRNTKVFSVPFKEAK